jgi:hypothetical protein
VPLGIVPFNVLKNEARKIYHLDVNFDIIIPTTATI